MNSTITSAGLLTEKVNGLGYFIGISVGLFFLIATIALASLYCKNALQTPYSSRPQRPFEQSLAVHIGLDDTTIQSYPTLVYSKAKLDSKEKSSSCCSICLSDYENTDILRRLPDCEHIFHMKCVDPWLHLHPTCPICRSTPIATPISTPLAEVVPLYQMNNTLYANEVPTDGVNGVGYFVGISIGVIFLIATTALASFFCKQAPTTPYGSHNQAQEGPSITIDIGLDEMTLQKFPTLFYSKAKVKNKDMSSCCHICLSDYKNTDVLRQIPECGHLFHLKCVDPWLRRHPTCPVCRSTPKPIPVAASHH